MPRALLVLIVAFDRARDGAASVVGASLSLLVLHCPHRWFFWFSRKPADFRPKFQSRLVPGCWRDDLLVCRIFLLLIESVDWTIAMLMLRNKLAKSNCVLVGRIRVLMS
jgi:hypothetical protein